MAGSWRALGIAVTLASVPVSSAGCGKTTDEMPRPVYVWEGLQGSGSCGFRLAMDGDGVLWHDRECEPVPKYDRKRKLDEVEQGNIRRAFAGIQVEPGTLRQPCAERGPGVVHVFTILAEDGRLVERRACATGEVDDPTGLPAVYERAARAFPR